MCMSSLDGGVRFSGEFVRLEETNATHGTAWLCDRLKVVVGRSLHRIP